MARRLPPLRALIAFEAAARHLSVRAAAEELSVSPSAVSHQLRVLEDALGLRLFNRTTRRIRLTDAGYTYLQLVTGGLQRIAAATQEIVDVGYSEILTVHCAPSFAPAWLMPRIGSFIKDHPDIDVRIRATPDPVDFTRSAADVEIRYGLGETKGLVVVPLIAESIVPMASPAVARRMRGKPIAAALAGASLIHSERSHTGWGAWLRSHGIDNVNVARGLRFDRAYLSLQAAVDGLGVALESTVFAARDLDAGRLVRLFRRLAAPRRVAHFLVTSRENATLPKVTRFRQWIERESAAEREEQGPD